MLKIDPNSYADLMAHAVSEYPNECCGVLLGIRTGQTRNVSRIAQCRNVHTSPATRYSIDPADLISIQRKARDSRLEIIGFYHSHPDYPPTFSKTDLEQAEWVDSCYLIISVDDWQVGKSRAYLLSMVGAEKQVVEEPLTLL